MKKIRIVFVFACCLCCITCRTAVKPVTGVRALAPVMVDELNYVFENRPSQVHALNDTTLLLRFRHEVVWLQSQTGKVLRVFDVRDVATDSINLAWYKTHDPKHNYFSVRNDSDMGVSMEPQLLNMHCSNGELDLVIYAAIGHTKTMQEISPEQLNSYPGVAPALPPDSKVRIIENKTWLLRLSPENKIKSAALIIGPAEPNTQPLFLAAPEFGFSIIGNAFYTAGVKPGGLPDFEYTLTARDSSVLLGTSVFREGMLQPENILLATHTVPGYRYTLNKQLQPKYFRTWNDTLFVNAEYGLYTLPDAKPYPYQFRDTTGEIRNRAFAKLNNTIAYLVERKNPADTGSWQQVLRITDQRTNKLLFFAPAAKSTDVSAYQHTFYTITADEEHYYINRYETY